jgi:hypothetical protein
VPIDEQLASARPATRPLARHVDGDSLIFALCLAVD